MMTKRGGSDGHLTSVGHPPLRSTLDEEAMVLSAVTQPLHGAHAPVTCHGNLTERNGSS